jgi:Predicted ATP-grasp enzyme
MNLDFIPLLFAGDINVYSMARAFHEEYGVKPVVYGKYASGPCVDSQILEYRPVEEADQQDTFLRLVLEFASENPYSKILLIGCGDSYVQLISANKKAFPENVIAPYIDIDLMNRVIHKEHFYELCEASGVDYPSTFVHRKEWS